MKLISKWLAIFALTGLTACGDGDSSSSSSSSSSISSTPDTSNTFTSLATALQNYVATDQAGSSTTNNKSSSMNSSIVLGAD